MRARETVGNQTALYLRLSKDDEGAGESASIANQRKILQEYARANGLHIAGEYTDDGYTGTNYDRPAFQRLLADIEGGRINCVLTKDLSRLGRNSARTLDLLDEYFPSRGVRYISVLDGYDSLHRSNGCEVTASFMALLHEMYARDISSKIRASFDAKREKGEYIGSFAPYGYQKDTQHGQKNHLAVDGRVAYLVQGIFQLAAEGVPPGEIARRLNGQGVATPGVYRLTASPFLCPAAGEPKKWSSSMVCKLLRNEVYLGRTVQGKTSKVSFKRKEVRRNPPGEWIRVEHTHEPLVTEELFEAVRRRMVSRRNPPANGFENLFSGIAKCAGCGRNMSLVSSGKRGSRYCLACGGYKNYGGGKCSNHFIDYRLLCHAVWKELQQRLSLPEAEMEDLRREEGRCHESGSGNASYPAMLARMQRRRQELQTLQKQLYEDHAFHRIAPSAYDRLTAEYAAEEAALEQSINSMQRQSGEHPDGNGSRLDENARGEKPWMPQALTRQLLRTFIDRIEIEQGSYIREENGRRHKEQRIHIYYRFTGGEGAGS